MSGTPSPVVSTMPSQSMAPLAKFSHAVRSCRSSMWYISPRLSFVQSASVASSNESVPSRSSSKTADMCCEMRR